MSKVAKINLRIKFHNFRNVYNTKEFLGIFSVLYKNRGSNSKIVLQFDQNIVLAENVETEGLWKFFEVILKELIGANKSLSRLINLRSFLLTKKLFADPYTTHNK